ncbi:hypothetical protein PtrSN002B_000024 [Pyrenophora tritici-repentis]|uniref:Uncharacterized protein n=2 Tax=Pyrenophora tritici-repentis TaxID=45151 RepID=A0A2W1H444_9PLEO|nr:uncharacterized protein PTRG_07389 [Pyrenophora tritici-repentis Pt-1C-BFP]KAA8614978.1 hypothetical protein PtrV1_12008 [Pyrenophora tritici-repentis]EDU50308.1 conserved hypothetical protein [Pyrenophora tritici-repentis Pt-1C-BFP]KAF7444801.1 hypothetical protein A1F99_113540 [Pyrenophora tritici-repentis]KAF7564541.1 hypothetical protein PtrM4_039750 [Pyrenophora tritici-repentis]KAG9379038.1 hypothetical protein A1F94_010807 [Pyrenophora tritici-repentis]
MFTRSALVFAFLGLTSAFATPTKSLRLEDLQCRCLSFSTSAAPTLCTYQELVSLDWDAAYLLATTNDLKIQFASEAAVHQVLSIPRHLPTSVLQTVQEGEARPLDPSNRIQNENRIICGFGDEIEVVGNDDRDSVPEIHYIGAVLGIFMSLLIIYLIAEFIWIRFVTRTGSIKLEGDEKTLVADCESTPLIVTLLNQGVYNTSPSSLP